ncbi:hypothetical protein [Alkalicoccus urumqiensis]|uniref:hypothetical protein n=1 Tax=Alkalicoccus urumqiensis TaxID=1548213 RepID=UPI0015E625BC|nr:hypothetical protein [Alkalicoccus urumqiensis]
MEWISMLLPVMALAAAAGLILLVWGVIEQNRRRTAGERPSEEAVQPEPVRHHQPLK